jgi:hypothetical protein
MSCSARPAFTNPSQQQDRSSCCHLDQLKAERAAINSRGCRSRYGIKSPSCKGWVHVFLTGWLTMNGMIAGFLGFTIASRLVFGSAECLLRIRITPVVSSRQSHRSRRLGYRIGGGRFQFGAAAKDADLLIHAFVAHHSFNRMAASAFSPDNRSWHRMRLEAHAKNDERSQTACLLRPNQGSAEYLDITQEMFLI